VGAEVPAYRKYVDEQVVRQGRNNPLVRIQYYSEEIDQEGGMFPLSRRLLMTGAHARQSEPTPGKAYVFASDVAVQDESAADLASSPGVNLENPARDSTVLTVFEVDGSTGQDALLRKPTYRVVNRYAWQGVKHTRL
jgi:hypothetical protein